MKVKSGLDLSTSDFFYDLFFGGYIDPNDILEDPKDAKRVYMAMGIIEDFMNSIEGEYPDFLQ